MECKCGHDFFDHTAVTDESRSGAVAECRFSTCGCKGFEEQEG